MTERDDLPAPPTAGPRAPQRVIVASLVGTSLEWYDFFLYGTADCPPAPTWRPPIAALRARGRCPKGSYVSCARFPAETRWTCCGR